MYDGGGILPDILLETSEYSGVTQALMEKNAIFDYATNYYYNHQLAQPEQFKFTDADYEDFKKFLNSTDFDYTTKTEKELKETFKTAKEEGFNEDIKNQYQKLLKEIEKAKAQDLEDKKPEIVSLLTDEIIKRYFYQEGLYDYYIEENPEIIKAKEILNNPNEYNKILGRS